jgi:hypothetical protein
MAEQPSSRRGCRAPQKVSQPLFASWHGFLGSPEQGIRTEGILFLIGIAHDDLEEVRAIARKWLDRGEEGIANSQIPPQRP